MPTGDICLNEHAHTHAPDTLLELRAHEAGTAEELYGWIMALDERKLKIAYQFIRALR